MSSSAEHLILTTLLQLTWTVTVDTVLHIDKTGPQPISRDMLTLIKCLRNFSRYNRKRTPLYRFMDVFFELAD